MYALETTDIGGCGTFASVGSIYNQLARDDPELLAVLFKNDWPMDRYVTLCFQLSGLVVC